MNGWPKFPIIYEINTWTWLGELSRDTPTRMTLASVPAAEWDRLATIGCDVVWLMGVWERSLAGREIAQRNENLLSEFHRVLPDFQAEDNLGSAYCVRAYKVDVRLGGALGLAMAREQLAQRGMRLMLDFVPNHAAPDHEWVKTNPEFFIQGDETDLSREPDSFARVNERIFACGRDPYSGAWRDVLQFNVFSAGLRDAMIDTAQRIASQCDAVRCDMAMLVLNEIFERTWGVRAGAKPTEEYWSTLIASVRTRRPEFKFVAEVYWDLEAQLQTQGFDFCYDKRLYDQLVHESAERVMRHVSADPSYQAKLVRFLENHDEPRAATSFPDLKLRAAAVALMTLPGARLLHEGQIEGRKVRVPVFLSRRPTETVDEPVADFFRRLLAAVRPKLFREGAWAICPCTGWPDNQSCLSLLAWCWSRVTERSLIVINYSGFPAQGLVHVPWEDLKGQDCVLSDQITGEAYIRNGSQLSETGLYVELAPWCCHFWVLRQAVD